VAALGCLLVVFSIIVLGTLRSLTRAERVFGGAFILLFGWTLRAPLGYWNGRAVLASLGVVFGVALVAHTSARALRRLPQRLSTPIGHVQQREDYSCRAPERRSASSSRRHARGL
jgi:hypothetical protein